MKRQRILCTLLFVFVLLLLSGCGAKQTAQTLTVNGEPVTAQELEYFESLDRASVIRQYAQKYGVTDFSAFWDTEYDGATPAQTLRKQARADAVDAKIRMILMRDNGIYDEISFDALRSRAESYNKTAQAKKTVGAATIDLDSFYTYYLETGEQELKNKLGESLLQPTEAEIEAYRAEHGKSLSEEAVKTYLIEEKYKAYLAQQTANADVKGADPV